MIGDTMETDIRGATEAGNQAQTIGPKEIQGGVRCL